MALQYDVSRQQQKIYESLARIGQVGNPFTKAALN